MRKSRISHKKTDRFGDAGSIPVLFAVALIPLIGCVGGAIDYGRSIVDRTRLNSALDAAVIVGAQAAASADSKGLTGTAVVDAARIAALASFNATPKLNADVKPTFTASVANRSVSVTGDYTASTATTLLKALGFGTFPLVGHSQSGVDLTPSVDVYLLVDVSASMAIGATSADIAKLRKNLGGCAFACHDGAKVNNTQYDSFQWAQANGVTLRLNEMNTGIQDFMTWMQTQPNAANRFRVALYSFSNDLTKLVDITSNFNQVSNNLPQLPSSSSSTAGGTHFKENMPQFASLVGTGGDGYTRPKKLVIIATDGVQDQDRTWSTASNPVAAGQGVAPFDPKYCRLLDPSVYVGVLYTPYIDLNWDWGYNATLGQPSQIGGPARRFEDIIPQLQSCATAANLYVNAATTSSVGAAFQGIIQSFTQIRLAQ